MSNDGVDEADQIDGIKKIRLHLCTLGNGSSDNGGKSASKGKLEEPIFETNIVTREEEARVANKGLLGAVVVAAIGKSVSDGPKSQTTATRIEEIPKNHVLDTEV